MVVMTVACGDSGRAEQNKANRCRREGSDKEQARFPHALETRSERPALATEYSSSRARASGCLCPCTPG